MPRRSSKGRDFATIARNVVEEHCRPAALRNGLRLRELSPLQRSCNVRVKRLQCDEIWSFVGAKRKNVTAKQEAEGWGDVLDVDGD